jgi:hypothetical protein
MMSKPVLFEKSVNAVALPEFSNHVLPERPDAFGIPTIPLSPNPTRLYQGNGVVLMRILQSVKVK